MTKIKVIATTVLLILVAAVGYQYLPTRTEQDKENAITVEAIWSPTPLTKSSRSPVILDIYVYKPKGGPEKYGFSRWESPFSYVIYADTGDRVLFSAARHDAWLEVLSCSITYHGKQVRFNNKPNDGLVTCDWIVT